MKKIVLTENEKNRIRSLYETNKGNSFPISEQNTHSEEVIYIQKFLNEHPKIKANLKTDGLAGSETEKAIEKYQMLLGVNPTDGIWGPQTQKMMPEKDKMLLDDIKNRDTLMGKAKSFLGLK